MDNYFVLKGGSLILRLLNNWLGKQVELAVSGCQQSIQGEIIDIGSDIVVLYGDNRFIYLPIHHLQSMRLLPYQTTAAERPPEPSFDHHNIMYRKILMNARGMFSEVSLGDKTLHGYVTAIMNDYFAFFSPLHRSVYVAVNHVKYIVPYPPNITPFSLSYEHFPIQPSSMSLSRTFEQQLKKIEGEIVTINLEGKPYRAGLLKSMDNNLLQLVEAGGGTVIMHADHVKTVHVSL